MIGKFPFHIKITHLNNTNKIAWSTYTESTVPHRRTSRTHPGVERNPCCVTAGATHQQRLPLPPPSQFPLPQVEELNSSQHPPPQSPSRSSTSSSSSSSSWRRRKNPATYKYTPPPPPRRPHRRCPPLLLPPRNLSPIKPPKTYRSIAAARLGTVVVGEMHLYNEWLPPAVADAAAREPAAFSGAVGEARAAWRPDDPDSAYATLKWISVFDL